MKSIIQINKFAYLHNNNNIFFCKTDYLTNLFNLLNDKIEDCTIITGNSDYEINDDIIEYAPKCIKRWFAQNANTKSNKVFGLPIGIENDKNCILEGHGVGWEHAKQKVEFLKNPPNVEPTKNIYANFSLDTHTSRVKVAEICTKIPHITKDISNSHNQINNKSYEKYIQEILEHRMVLCPRGNGIDCHRVWEVLYLGRIPIVKKEIAMLHFKQLPILFIDDWQQLYDKSFLENEYEKVKNNSTEMLDVKYWNNKILFNE
jgi:hypothetical protein